MTFPIIIVLVTIVIILLLIIIERDRETNERITRQAKLNQDSWKFLTESHDRSTAVLEKEQHKMGHEFFAEIKDLESKYIKLEKLFLNSNRCITARKVKPALKAKARPKRGNRVKS